MTTGAGVAIGAALMGLITPRAPDTATLNYLIGNKPEFYKFIDIDMSIARTDQVYDEAGTFIWIDNQFARGDIQLALNEQKFDKYDLRRQEFIEGPFYRFYITNIAGQGKIRLFISRGYHAASKPIESITRAELAARLGSVHTFDRRGDLLWYDDFESGIGKWDTITSGVGAEVSWSADYARTGGFSCKMTAGRTGNKRAMIINNRPIPILSGIGVEIAWHSPTAVDLIDIELYLYDGTNLSRFVLRYDDSNRDLIYFDGVLGWTTLNSDLDLDAWNKIFYQMKLVVDLTLGKYVRCIINDLTYTMDNKPGQVVANATTPYMDLSITVDGTTWAGNDVAYLDSVLITQNEPA